MNNTIQYSTFNPANMSCVDPVEKNVPVKTGMAPGSGGKYKEVPIKYNYGVDGEIILDELLMEWPELHSSGGLTEKQGLSGRPEFTIMVSIPQTGESGVLIEKMNQLHKACAEFIHKFKGPLGCPMFKVEMAEAMGFKNPILQRDRVTGELLVGRNASIFLKCFVRGAEKTLFHRPVEKVNPKTGLVEINPETGKKVYTYQALDWEIVKGAEIWFRPLIHIKKIYQGGGKCSLQLEVRSVVIKKIIPRGSSSLQMESINKMVEEDPDIVNNLDEQIARLMALKQNVLERTMGPASTNGYAQPDPNNGTIQQINQFSGGAPNTNTGQPNTNSGLNLPTGGPSSFAHFSENTPTPGAVDIPKPVVTPGPPVMVIRPPTRQLN